MDKVSLFRFWMVYPAKRMCDNIASLFRKNFGYWYCAGCKKEHSPRVIKYHGKVVAKVFGIPLKADVCSLHKDGGEY